MVAPVAVRIDEESVESLIVELSASARAPEEQLPL